MPAVMLVALSVLVTERSAEGMMVSVSVSWSFPEEGSVVPVGGAIFAEFTMLPDAPAVPVMVKVRLPPEGSVGMMMPVPCMRVIVVLAGSGHAALPVAEPQVTPVTVRLETAGSVKTAVFAEDGPALLTTIV